MAAEMNRRAIAAIVGVFLLGLVAVAAVVMVWRVLSIRPAKGAETQPPYTCGLLYDEQKKCAFGPCDQRVIERLRNECPRDGGRP